MTMLIFTTEDEHSVYISSNNDEEEALLHDYMEHFEWMNEEDRDMDATHQRWDTLREKHVGNQVLMADVFQRWLNLPFPDFLKEFNQRLGGDMYYINKKEYWYNNTSIDEVNVLNTFVQVDYIGSGIILSKKNNQWLMAHFQHDGGLNMRWELSEHDVTKVKGYSFLRYRFNSVLFKDVKNLIEYFQPEIEAFNAKHASNLFHNECMIY